MISVLITAALNSKTLDKLNEIPEFEINETALAGDADFALQVQNVDALVVGKDPALPAGALKKAANLKLVIVSGEKADWLERALAGLRPGIDVRVAPPAAVGSEAEGQGVIAILKDFFNV